MLYFILLLLLLNTISSYDEYIAIKSVNLTQCTYCNNFDIADYVVENFGSLAIQGFDSETQTIFTAFRGSSNIYNWIEDIHVEHIYPYKNESLSVETGFYKSYCYIKKMLFENLYILSKQYNTSDLLITGHSLGAAMSTLFAYDIIIYNAPFNIKHMYNFGSPRVGNTLFINDFNDNINNAYRVVHNNDIVASLPPKMFGYSHIKQGICYNENNTDYQICNDDISCYMYNCSTNDHLIYLNITLGSEGCVYILKD